jgi:hypothetical protein
MAQEQSSKERSAESGLIFEGNKAKTWLRINHLIQKPHKNKPNFRPF